MPPSTTSPLTLQANTVDSCAAALCHDLDNVLLSIDSHARALRAAGAATVCDGAERHLDAIERGLEFLRLRSLRVRGAIRRGRATGLSLRLDDWWRDLDRLARAVLSPHVSLHANFPATLPPVGIEADELTACVLHIIVNAGQAMSPRRTDGRVDITGSPARGDTVLVRVVDNGAGMSPETIRHAGRPGFTTRADGTGMGLHAVRQAVASVGGDLTINSTPGQGTEVQLRLPAATHIRSRCT